MLADRMHSRSLRAAVVEEACQARKGRIPHPQDVIIPVCLHLCLLRDVRRANVIGPVTRVWPTGPLGMVLNPEPWAAPHGKW